MKGRWNAEQRVHDAAAVAAVVAKCQRMVSSAVDEVVDKVELLVGLE